MRSSAARIPDPCRHRPTVLLALAILVIGLATANAQPTRESASIETLLEAAERASHGMAGNELRERLEALQEQFEDMTRRQRDRYRLIEIRSLARAGHLEDAAVLAIEQVEDLDAMDADLGQRALNLATNVLAVNGRFDEAFRYFRRALNRAPTIDDAHMQADTYSVAAEFYDRIGETATAFGYAEQALAIARANGLERQACIALERGGRALLHQGGMAEAATRFRAAIDSCERAVEGVFLASAQLGLARAQHALDQSESAERLADTAMSTFRRVGFPEGELETMVLKAKWALEADDPETAALWLADLEPALEGPGDLGVRAEAWRLRAELAKRTGDRPRAMETLRRAMELRRERSERQRAMRIALLINEQDIEARGRELTLLRDRNRALVLENERRQQADLGLIYGGVGALVAAVLVVFLLIKTASDRKRFRRMSQHDGLTGLLNHTRFFQLAHQAYLRCCQQERPFVIVVADIDLFKQINDGHGHLVGDAILRRTGDCLREVFGSDALLGRLGGEEFGIALPGEDTDAAVARIEHLRAVINATRASGEPDITLSFGVAERGRERGLDALYARADQALYDAKDAGRNRVVTVARLSLNPARFTT